VGTVSKDRVPIRFWEEGKMNVDRMTDSQLNFLIKARIRAGDWEGAKSIAATVHQRRARRESSQQKEGDPRP
jgi:hypothetical protein